MTSPPAQNATLAFLPMLPVLSQVFVPSCSGWVRVRGAHGAMESEFLPCWVR